MATEKQRTGPPKVDAFLLCDHVHTDPATGKYTVLGVWDTMEADAFPATHDAFGLYFNLTGMNGTYRFSVVILAPDLSTVVARFEVEPPRVASSPLERHEIAFNFVSLVFPGPGRHTVQLLYNGSIAHEFTITALLLGGPARSS